jgi:hypothetical protein
MEGEGRKTSRYNQPAAPKGSPQRKTTTETQQGKTNRPNAETENPETTPATKSSPQTPHRLAAPFVKKARCDIQPMHTPTPRRHNNFLSHFFRIFKHTFKNHSVPCFP